MFRQIKWAYQRVCCGYYDRIYWGFEEVIITIIPPLKKFCEDCLAVEHIHLNPYRKEVFEETLRLIETYKTESYKEMFNGTNLNNLSKYFGEHVGYYWD